MWAVLSPTLVEVLSCGYGLGQSSLHVRVYVVELGLEQQQNTQ